MKGNTIKNAAALAVILTGVYFLTRYGLSSFYTPEWGARNFFWLAALMIFIPALFGKIKFSMIALAGYLTGLITGELFGGFQSEVPPQYLHYGWLILILVFFASCGIGAFIEGRTRAC